ncbi:MAG TPA: AsmA family protein [Opitutaceae bacterium]
MYRQSICSERAGGALKGILLVLVVLTLVLVIGWIVFLPGIVKGQVRSISGFPVEASRIRVNPFGATVLVDGFQLNNPAGFAVSDFVSVRALDLRVKPLSISGERLEIPQLMIDLEKITFVTNKDGVSNASLFKKNIDEALGGSEDKPSDEPAKPFHISLLQVKLGKIEIIDYSKGETPEHRVVELGVDRTFTDVTDPKVVVTPIMADILKANLPGLAGELSNLLPEEYSETVGNALRDVQSILNDPNAPLDKKGKAVGDSAKKFFESLKGDSKP